MGSVNQIEPSEATATSLGEFSFLPLYLSAMTVIEPSSSVRVTRRPPCSQLIRRPSRSIVLPFEFIDGWRKTLRWPSSSQYRMIRLLGMSLNSTYRPAGKYTGPSAQRMPVAMRSTAIVPAKPGNPVCPKAPLVLETTFSTSAGKALLLDCMAVGKNERGHQLGAEAPHALLRSLRCTDGEVEFELEYAPRPEYGLVYPLLSEIE